MDYEKMWNELKETINNKIESVGILEKPSKSDKLTVQMFNIMLDVMKAIEDKNKEN